MKRLIAFIILFIPFISLGYTTKNLTDLGYGTGTAKYIIQECNKIQGVQLKKGTGDSQHCIRLAAAIGCAESSCGKKSSLNPWGFRNQKFKSQVKAFDAWIKSYKKYRYNRKRGAIDFYSLNGIPSPTRYCTEEASSGNRKFHCGNGYKHFTTVRNKLLNIKTKQKGK